MEKLPDPTFIEILGQFSNWLGLFTAGLAVYFLKRYVDKVDEQITTNRTTFFHANKELEKDFKEVKGMVSDMKSQHSNIMTELRSTLKHVKTMSQELNSLKGHDLLQMRGEVLNLTGQIEGLLEAYANGNIKVDEMTGKIILIDKTVEILDGRMKKVEDSKELQDNKVRKLFLIMKALNEDVKKVKSKK